VSNFDYRKESINFIDLVPEQFNTDVNQSLFSNGIDRLLTVEDTVPVQGYIGNNNSNKHFIVEDSLPRQTYQLQPLIYSKIATVEHISAFSDIVNKLEVLDEQNAISSRYDKWMNCDQFNFAPPIDIDKFLNYRDYFWVDDSEPDYITLNNPVTRIDSSLFELETSGVSDKSSIKQNLLQQKAVEQQRIKDGLSYSNIDPSKIDSKYQWISYNKWVHKSELIGRNNIHQAKLPIIEYYDNLEINEWTYTKHNWNYRKDTSSKWDTSSEGPSDDELNTRFPIQEVRDSSFKVEGDASHIITVDQLISVVDSFANTGQHKVVTVTYDDTDNSSLITVDKPLNKHDRSAYVSGSNDVDVYNSSGYFHGVVYPYSQTSKGDVWLGLHSHWKLVSINEPVPVNHQPVNELQKTFVYSVSNYGYDVNQYDGYEYLYGYDGQSRFKLPIDYILDSDDVQVYINGVRQYGTYAEAFDIDNNSYYDVDAYNTHLYDEPRFPKRTLSNFIEFKVELKPKDVVMVKVGPACSKDVNKHGCYVNMNGTLMFKNLVEYKQHEQIKTSTNQYLMFDIYNVDSTTNYSANEIFKYYEDVSADVNTILKVRTPIVHNNYTFSNLLVNDKNELLCYKEYTPLEVLNTVWRKSSTQFTPIKVDKYRKTTSQLDKDWALPDPLKCNIKHECRAVISYGEMFSHFNSILSAQPATSYVSASRVAKTSPKLDFIGGNIKEHNGGLDLFISTMHQDTINLLALIKFAKNQYTSNISELRNHVLKKSTDILTSNITASIDDLYSYAIKQIQETFLNNYKLDEVFYDTTAYDGTDGVKNWVATLPILGLYPAFEPTILKDTPKTNKPTINYLRHHDGHLTDMTVSADEYADFYGLLPTSTDTENGTYKLENNVLYRYHIDFKQDIQPGSTSFGKRWYNTDDDTLHTYNGSAWVTVDKDTAWDVFNINHVLEQCLLTVEQRLYAKAKKTRLKLNFSNYVNDEFSLFVDYMKNNCLSFIKRLTDVSDPLPYDVTNAFTWNYNNIVSSANTGVYVKQSDGTQIQNSTGLTPKNWSSYWKRIYELQYGTAYPHLEPWKLQNYSEKPEQWDSVYGDLTGARRWKPIMWSNIRSGIIHSSLPSPLSAPKTYSVISVNDTAASVGTYSMDDLLPPYIKVNNTFDELHSLVRNISSTPASISAKPVFGNQSYIERKWMESIDYPYDMLTTMFKMQPVKFVSDTFGHDLVNVNGLMVDKYTKKVPTYTDTIFHGSTVNGSTYLVNGINQWYVNALRYDRNVISLHDFVETWTNWTPKLSYQTNTVLNTTSLLIDNDYFKITDSDYNVTMKKSTGVRDIWMHSIRLSLATKGTSYTNLQNVQVPKEDDWEFRVDTMVTEGNTLNYYDVRKYNIDSVNVNTNNIICSTTRNGVKTSNLPWIAGDVVHIKYDGINIKSTTPYTLINAPSGSDKLGLAVYDSYVGHLVQIDLYDKINSYSYSRNVQNNEYVFAYDSNRILYIDNGITMYPLSNYMIKYDTTTHKVYQYFDGFWVYSNNSFIIPDPVSFAIIADNGVALEDGKDYILSNSQTKYEATVTLIKNVSKLQVSYNNVVTLTCFNYSKTVIGSEILFNISNGMLYNVTQINYLMQPSEISVSEIVLRDYDLKYNTTTNTLTQYRNMINTWVDTKTNAFILPVIHNNIYLYDNDIQLTLNTDYAINLTNNKITLLSPINNLTIKIAIPDNTPIEERFETFNNALSGKKWYHMVLDKTTVKSLTVPSTITGVQNVIDFIDGYSHYLADNGFIFNDYSRPLNDPSSNALMSWQNEIDKFINKVYSGFNTKLDNVLTPNSYYDYIDLCPFRYQFWVGTPTGVVSNILSGPYRDVTLYPIVYDNFGTPITSTENLKIFRQDKESHISYPINTSKYIGGMHLFIDNYEHVIMFNDYTTNNNMLFDSFLGLNNDLIQLKFEKHYETTKRPNISGGFLVNNIIVDNIESSAEMLSNFYNTYAPESNKHITAARGILGYNNDQYMNQMNSKSKFLFWKGMIHHKGTVDSVEKYAQINNIESVKLDEFWLYKLDDYGTNTPPEEFYLNIKTADINNDRAVYQFTSKEISENGTTQILYDDPTRWRNLPDINNTSLFDYVTTAGVRYIVNQYSKVSKSKYETKNFNDTNYVQLDELCEGVTIHVESNYNTVIEKTYSSEITGLPYYIPNTGMLSVIINGEQTKITELSPTSIKLPEFNYKPKVVIIYKKGTLVEGKHYTFTSNKTINFINMDWSICDLFEIISTKLDYSSLSANIIDTKNDLIISTANLYNPAFSIHNPKIKQIEYIVPNDPANYSDNFWGKEYVGKKWIDTKTLGYTMYYNEGVYPSLIDQITAWGTTTDWSYVTCYEWVKSNTPPTLWVENITKTNTANNSIILGAPLTKLMKRVRPTANDNFSDWYEETTTTQVANVYDHMEQNTAVIPVDLTINPVFDNFKVYVNEIHTTDITYTTKVGGVIDLLTVNAVNNTDIVRIVRFVDVPNLNAATTEEDLQQYKLEYVYNTIKTYDNTGTTEHLTYYFWVTNQISRDNDHKLSTSDVEEIFVNNPVTYSFVLPNNVLVIKHIDTYITTNNYAFQLLKIPAVQANQQYVDTNKHAAYSEWKMIRKYGVNKIPKTLWDKVTETLLEHSFDGSYRIPTFDRVLFDRTNNTSTRYGVGKYQSMGEKAVVLEIIDKILYDDLFNISPLDKDDFLEQYTFDTSENIITTMTYMYDNFSSTCLNEIFFSVLTELFSNSDKVDNIMKTSMISLDCTFSMNAGS
jgi:hypothetical protein